MPAIKITRDLIWARKHHKAGTILNVNRAGRNYLLGTNPPSGEDVSKDKDAVRKAIGIDPELDQQEDELEPENEKKK